MGRLPTFIFFILLHSSCMQIRDTDEGLYSLYRQKIESSNYELYEFAYMATFTFTSDFTGVTMLDSATEFSRNAIDDLLPCSYFSTIPRSNNWDMIAIDHGWTTHEQDTLLKPFRQYTSAIGDVELNISEYRGTYGSATMSTGLMEYEFDSFQELRDSLIFYNVTKKFGGKVLQPRTAFLKGNIKVLDAADKSIVYIDVEQLIIERGAIYKPTRPLDLVSDRPIVGIATYRFRPRMMTKSDGLTEYGIWKRVK